MLERRGWNQSRFALRIKVNPSSVTRWFLGQRALSPEKAKRIQKATRARWDEIFGRIETKCLKEESSSAANIAET